MRSEAVLTEIAKHLPGASGAAGIVLLGIPQGVLIAAFFGAVISFYFRERMDDQKIPRIVFGVIAIAFAGAWVSLALPHIDWLGLGAMATKVDPAARAGLCALAFQSAWNFGHRWTSKKVERA